MKRSAPEEFWVRLRGGSSTAEASAAVGVSSWVGYRWLHEVGGPAAVGLTQRPGRPWGGRKSQDCRDRFWAALTGGATVAAAARAAGVSRGSGKAWLVEAGGVLPRTSNPTLEASVKEAAVKEAAVKEAAVKAGSGTGRLSFGDRCRIEELDRLRYRPAQIADLLGRSRSTITRELDRGRPSQTQPAGQLTGQPSQLSSQLSSQQGSQRGSQRGSQLSSGQGRHRAVVAQERVEQAQRRAGRPAKLAAGTALFEEVVTRLAQLHSPEQIAGRLRQDFPDGQEMWVSHETIYQALYVRPRSELAVQVKQAIADQTVLRSGRTRRRPHGRQPRPRMKNMINIAERPAPRLHTGHTRGRRDPR